MERKLEICCYTLESAIKAEKSGADRIELCDNYSEGGTTPSFAVIDYSIQKLNIPVNVIVRPRGGDFLYSELEYNIIKHEISMIKELHAKGRPILIGTESVEVSEKLSRILKQNSLPNTVLNAKNHSKEAQIIADAGKKKSITIATNMAGRGTDIKL